MRSDVLLKRRPGKPGWYACLLLFDDAAHPGNRGYCEVATQEVDRTRAEVRARK